eukprot:scaffold1112_cov116-Isochrysis_galbana.AAC.26
MDALLLSTLAESHRNMENRDRVRRLDPDNHPLVSTTTVHAAAIFVRPGRLAAWMEEAGA